MVRIRYLKKRINTKNELFCFVAQFIHSLEGLGMLFSLGSSCPQAWQMCCDSPIGRLTSQFIQDILSIRLRFYLLHCWHDEWIKEAIERRGRLDELTPFLQSAWSSRRHHQNTIIAFYLLAFFGWLFSFACFFPSVMTSEKFWILKSRDTVHYIKYRMQAGFKLIFKKRFVHVVFKL